MEHPPEAHVPHELAGEELITTSDFDITIPLSARNSVRESLTFEWTMSLGHHTSLVERRVLSLLPEFWAAD